jgi:hypothetical protein
MDALASLDCLEELDIENCDFTGALLPALSTMPRLRHFHAKNNSGLTFCPCDDPRLCACRPALPWLRSLWLTNCELGVSVRRLLTTCLSGCPRLRELIMDNNALHGPLALSEDVIAFGATLTYLDLRFNRIEGPLTAGFLSHFPNLASLDLESNRLMGPLPEAGLPFDTLRRLCLSGNPRLTGPVPLSWRGLRHLVRLTLGPLLDADVRDERPGFWDLEALKSALPRYCQISWEGGGQVTTRPGQGVENDHNEEGV